MRPGAIRGSRNKLVWLALALSVFPSVLPAAGAPDQGDVGNHPPAAWEVDLPVVTLSLTARLSDRSLASAKVEAPWPVAVHDLPAGEPELSVVVDAAPWLSDMLLDPASLDQPSGLIKAAYATEMNSAARYSDTIVIPAAAELEEPHADAAETLEPVATVSAIIQPVPDQPAPTESHAQIPVAPTADATSVEESADVPHEAPINLAAAQPHVTDAGPAWALPAKGEEAARSEAMAVTQAPEITTPEPSAPSPLNQEPAVPSGSESAAAPTMAEQPTASAETNSSGASSLFWAAVNAGSQNLSQLFGMPRQKDLLAAAEPETVTEAPAQTPAPLMIALAATEPVPMPESAPANEVPRPVATPLQLAQLEFAAPRQDQAIAAGVNPDIKLAALTPAPKEAWRVPPGMSLRQMLMDWAARAGWIVTWDATVDYETIIANEFRGDFEDAISGLFNAFPASIPLRAELRTANVPPLLIVTQSRRPLQ